MITQEVNMVFKQGEEWNGNANGRGKGTRNKFSELKQTFKKAFEQSGGLERLVELCKDDANFMALSRWLISLLPKEMQIKSAQDNTMHVILNVPRPVTEELPSNVIEVQEKVYEVEGTVDEGESPNE